MRSLSVAVPLLIAAAVTAYARAEAEPKAFEPTFYLPRSHSHNDYAQARPLFEALERGFASIEVDVFLVDGALLVGHEPEKVRPDVTLGQLYLDPLRDIARRNGGSVYAGSDQSLQLLIDVKSEADATYRALHETLRGYADLFTTWTADGSEQGAVTAVLSGNRATALIGARTPRYVAIDGRVQENRSKLGVDLVPLVSVDWKELGPLEERPERARALVVQLHAEGRKVRFWATPEREDLWQSLIAMDVDYVGTDQVDRLDPVLRAASSPSSLTVDR